MKIGEFCRHFHISEHTIRFYIDKGLLVPDVRNKQYQFTCESIFDMDMILQMKQCGFSLDEIHGIVSLYRITRFAAPKDLEKLQEMYTIKLTSLTKKLDENGRQIKELAAFVEELAGEY